MSLAVEILVQVNRVHERLSKIFSVQLTATTFLFFLSNPLSVQCSITWLCIFIYRTEHATARSGKVYVASINNGAVVLLLLILLILSLLLFPNVHAVIVTRLVSRRVFVIQLPVSLRIIGIIRTLKYRRYALVREPFVFSNTIELASPLPCRGFLLVLTLLALVTTHGK